MAARPIIALALPAPILLAACAGRPALPVYGNLVTIAATEYAFAAPDTIPAGLTTVRLVNDGKELHQAVLARLDSGKTLTDLEAAMLQRPASRPPAWLAFPMGANLTDPGDSSNATAVLAPGHYAILCFVPAPDGRPHIMKGMARTLEVVPDTAPPVPEPTADLVIAEQDYTWDFSAPITPGTHTIRVENAGPQLHEVTVLKLPYGKTTADLQTWLQGGMRGLPPAIPIGGFVGPDPGGHGFFTATFKRGDYVLISLVPDRGDGRPQVMHGMIKSFTVS